MANNVIYLPPGVVPPSPAGAVQAQPQVAAPSGIPFDRNFFQTILPQAIQAFCKEADCDGPRVELLTVDGVTHYVNGISGVSDSWVALSVSEEKHPHPIQVFIPYQTIFRVEVHREEDPKRSVLGFAVREIPNTLEVLSKAEAAAQLPPPAAAASEPAKPAARKTSKTPAARGKTAKG